MLLNTKIEIEVTNDGKDNKTSVVTNKDANVLDVLTSLELAKNNITNGLELYFKDKTLDEQEFRKLTVKDIFNGKY